MKQLIIKNKICYVDDEDYELISKYNWYIKRSYNIFYAITNINKKKVRMHRLIYSNYYTIDKNDIIDHIDKNGLNNQKNNLRKCNKSQNSINTVKRKTNTSGFKGVSFYKTFQKYRATIHKDGIKYSLGYFNSPIDAAKAYNEKCIELFGEFAELNIIN